MKRKSIIAILAAVMVMLSAVVCCAGDTWLELKSSYPEDGQTNTSMENVGVKLYFDGTFLNESVRKADSKKLKIVDEEGTKVPADVLFSDKEDGLVLVVADVNNKDYQIKNNHNYTLVINKDFSDDNGKTLEKETKIVFKTYNQKVNNIVNVLMMVVMFGGIMFFTIRQNKTKEEKEDPKETKEAAFNPYKEAKRTGKSVDEVMAEEAKRQAKLAKKKKGKTKTKEPKQKFWCADYLNNVYHVHAPAPIHKTDRKSGSDAKADTKKNSRKK